MSDQQQLRNFVNGAYVVDPSVADISAVVQRDAHGRAVGHARHEHDRRWGALPQRDEAEPARSDAVPQPRLDPLQRSDAQAVEGLGVGGGVDARCGEGIAEPCLRISPLFP